MNLNLTSDFPSTANAVVVEQIRSTAEHPRVAWSAPFTATGRERIPAAQAFFRPLGASAVEYCDIDEAPGERQLAALHEYDVIYLAGGAGARTRLLDDWSA